MPRRSAVWFPRLAICAALCGVVAGSGCALPAPKIREAQLPAAMTFSMLCGDHDGTRTAVLEGAGEPVTVVLECARTGAVLVIFNTVGVRVRTMQIHSSGRVRDEVSYLASAEVAHESLLEAVLRALEGQPEHTTDYSP